MLGDIKALFVVLIVATLAFAVAKPICVRYTEPADFNRRRNVWFALTLLGFMSPTIWVYTCVALPVMYVAGKRDRNPLSLYVLLLFVIPNVSVAIPVVGIGALIDVNHARLMSMAILLPAVIRQRSTNVAKDRFTAIDWLLLLYCGLQIVVLVPYESPTSTLRRSLLVFLDYFIVFYAFSRLARTRQSLREVVASVCLLAGVLAPLAMVESFKGWLLYQSIYSRWGIPDVQSWLLRGDALRAQVSTGHSLVLGYSVALGIGCWLYVQSQLPRSLRDTAIWLVLCAGLMVSYSRGAWLMAILIGLFYVAMRPGAAGFYAKAVPVAILLIVIAYVSPLKELLIDRLPIIGTVDQDTIEYRRRLADVSWALIKVHPLFGDPFYLNNMEEMRQGQGIIDIINGYIAVTLSYGFVGLLLFASFFLVGLWRCFIAMRGWSTRDDETMLLGAALCAMLVGSLFFVATAGCGPIEYLLTGLMIAYASNALPRAVGRTAVPSMNSNLRAAVR